MPEPPRRITLLALGAVLLAGLAVRLVHIADPYIIDYHSWRQADTAAFTHRYLEDTLNPLDPRVDRFPCEHRDSVFGQVESELPVTAWLAALPLAAAKVRCPPPPYLRAVSLLFFLGASLYLFLLARRLTGSDVLGVASVLIFSVLPLSLYFTRTVQPETPGLFFSLGFLYHLERWLDGEARGHAVASAALGALAVLQKITNVVVFLPAAYLIVARHGLAASIRKPRYWIWGLASLAPAAAWYAHIHDRVWGFGIWGGTGKYSSWDHLVNPSIWDVFSNRAVLEILTWGALILVVVGFARIRESLAVRFGAVWLVGQLVLLVATIPVSRVHVYYQLPMELPAAMIAAVGAGQLWRNGRPGRILLLGLAALHGVQLIHPLRGHYYVSSGRLKDGIELVNRHVPAGATFLSTDRNPALFSNTCRRGWFVRKPDVAAMESCMRDDLEYLLVQTAVRQKLARDPSAWADLHRRFTPLEVTKHYSIWRRSAPPRALPRAPAPPERLPRGLERR